MLRLTATALALAALAGCNRGPEVSVENASMGEVFKKLEASGAAKDAQLSPGQWRISSEVKDIQMAGLPKEAEAALRSQMAQNRTIERCVTPEEAARPTEAMFGGKEDGACRYESFQLGGGKLASVLRCSPPQGGSVVTKVSGEYSNADYRVDTRVEAQAPGDRGPQKMTMAVQTSGKRLGDCPAGGGNKEKAK